METHPPLERMIAMLIYYILSCLIGLVTFGITLFNVGYDVDGILIALWFGICATIFWPIFLLGFILEKLLWNNWEPPSDVGRYYK